MLAVPERMCVILAVLICWTLLAVVYAGEAVAYLLDGQRAQPQAAKQVKPMRSARKTCQGIEPERQAGLGQTG